MPMKDAAAQPAKRLTVTAVNPLPFARPRQTLELAAPDLAALAGKDLAKIRVRDESGRELLCQAVDADGDYDADTLIFQADFSARQTRRFSLSTGDKPMLDRSRFMAYGRFVRERFDDFVWENDRIAHRMYGKALETWVREPLASSTVDIWSKRTSRLVVSDWYMMDHYHTDTGEGADFYSAWKSRGCGGNGLWAKDKLWVSANFVHSRVLASGPIRVLFELHYEPFDVDGLPVSEVKRIQLDAGQNLNRFRSVFRPARPAALISGAGLKKVVGERKELNPELGSLCSWEPMEQHQGEQGIALIVDPQLLVKQTEDDMNWLMLTRVPDDNTETHWAGFCWDKSGQFPDEKAWRTYVDRFARGLHAPITVSAKAE